MPKGVGSEVQLALITSRYPWAPGESFLSPELEALAAMGVKVTIFPVVRGRGDPRPGPYSADASYAVPPTSVTSAARWLTAPFRSSGGPGTVARLTLEARGIKPTVANPLAAMAGLALAPRLRREGFTHVHGYWAAGAGTMAMAAATAAGLPWSFTGHRSDLLADHTLATKLLSATQGRFISETSQALARANLLRAGVAPDEAERLLQARSVVANLGVMLPEGAPGPGSAPRFFHPANLVPVKGHLVLLEAFERLAAEYPDAELEIAGDGPLRGTIEAEIGRRGLGERVRLLGTLPHEALLARYRERRYAATLLPSLDLGNGLHEGKPVALIEAMASALPVISTRSGGIPELVVGGTGLLVPPGDAGALAEAMATVLGEPASAAAMGELARGHVSRYYDVRRTVREFWAPLLGVGTLPAGAHEP